MKSNLAIVIPAYKADFFRATLQSLANQTCTDFTVYIGDDNSPYNLTAIVDEFRAGLNIVYQKFDKNMGGTNLVGQWNRCMDMAGDEEWIWFFSDDDTMTENCVEQFYAAAAQFPEKKIFHFDVNIINEQGDVINRTRPFPETIDVVNFHLGRWKSQLNTYVVEYIFSKEFFDKNGGFQEFDYAWHTDEATWTKLGHPAGITTIKNAFVNWRKSGVNITPNNADATIVNGKLRADMNYAEWVSAFYKQHGLSFTFDHKFYLAKRFVNHLAVSKRALPPMQWLTYLRHQLKTLKIGHLLAFFYVYYIFRLAKVK
ncbi:glycosyltransferase family 2 protein [Mucilaginibacter pedocola]|uniref:Glycosyltransferase 2-like domain-containing protein n=1 Tax=Mucilaginibacter pedocola TaxID=1792845 RepID=A0A1S9P7Z8_9SPHI|nr:glycosyltransferase family 2 protein [Mucilaginibacter pedocola]OOQ57093.1 hypothetical protein BC343_16325 [Mucilaginibacter pedocola]